MALKGVGYNTDYAGSWSIIYSVANGETAERNKITLGEKKKKKAHVNRIFVPGADFNQIPRFRTIVISNIKSQLFIQVDFKIQSFNTLTLLVTFLTKGQNMTCASLYSNQLGITAKINFHMRVTVFWINFKDVLIAYGIRRSIFFRNPYYVGENKHVFY